MVILICLVLSATVTTACLAGPLQEPVAADTQQATAPADLASMEEDYNSVVQEWRNAMKDVRTAGASFFYSPRSEAKKWRDEYREAVSKGARALAKLKPIAIELYKANPNPDADLKKLIAQIYADLYGRGRYQMCYDLGKVIAERNPGNAQVGLILGRAALMLSHFDEAADAMENYSSMIADLEFKEQQLFGNAATLAKQFEKELEQRKVDATANLPRVQIKTTKGTIVIELFEDQAPQTVGNFISLVEARFYDGKIFHRVINHFMAQTGGFTEDQSFKSVGYRIYDEVDRKDFRRHYRGSVAMAKESDPDTGNSQFYICFGPNPGLDGLHTVFGRVISGWDALDQINRTHEYNDDLEEKAIEAATFDKIISARVLRKRDHEYKPTPVKRQ